MVLFLCSDKAGFITGENICIDGGMTRQMIYHGDNGQQLIAPQFSTPTEVVSYMGAMQAQEYRMMRWAVAMRTRIPSFKVFKKAKAIAVTKGWMSSNRITIHDEELMRVRDILVRTAAGKRSVTKDDFVLALAYFTHKYFQSRQPATLEDFVWWSGLNISDCRRGIALLGDSIHIERWKGREYYLTEHRHRAHNNSGIFQPIIAYDGKICGNWSPFKEDFQASFFEEIFEPVDVSEAWQSYNSYRNK